MSSGCRTKNAGSSGTMRRTPYSGGKATRSTPERRSAPRAALSASSIASRASRARASNASPASVAETCRVVRTRSLTPRRRSSAAIERETEGWERPNSRAALEKLPLSTVRTNKASCCRRSFIPVSEYIISLWRNTYRYAHCLAQAHQSVPASIAAAAEKHRSRAMGELSGKVAIVTGASKGIGAAIALRFAEAGAAVAVNYSSDKSRRRPGRRANQARRRQGGRDPGECLKERRRQAPVRGDEGEAWRAQHPRQQRRRVHLRAARSGDGRGVPSPVRHQRFGDAARDSRGRDAPSTAKAAA